MQNVILFKKPMGVRLSVFSGAGRADHLEEDRELTYRCWRSVWGGVFRDEMKLQKALFSDEFSRQDMIVSLFQGKVCVGLAMIRLLSLDSEMTFDDSFFRFWTPESLKKISRMSTDGGPLALASSFTVHPDFRGRKDSINWKSLLLALFLEKFLTTNAKIMVTAARKIRSNEKLCQGFGAKLLDGNIPFLLDGREIPGEIADLLYWPRNLIIDLGSSELNELKDQLWHQRNDLCSSEGERHAA